MSGTKIGLIIMGCLILIILVLVILYITGVIKPKSTLSSMDNPDSNDSYKRDTRIETYDVDNADWCNSITINDDDLRLLRKIEGLEPITNTQINNDVCLLLNTQTQSGFQTIMSNPSNSINLLMQGIINDYNIMKELSVIFFIIIQKVYQHYESLEGDSGTTFIVDCGGQKCNNSTFNKMTSNTTDGTTEYTINNIRNTDYSNDMQGLLNRMTTGSFQTTP